MAPYTPSSVFGAASAVEGTAGTASAAGPSDGEARSSGLTAPYGATARDTFCGVVVPDGRFSCCSFDMYFMKSRKYSACCCCLPRSPPSLAAAAAEASSSPPAESEPVYVMGKTITAYDCATNYGTSSRRRSDPAAAPAAVLITQLRLIFLQLDCIHNFR